MGLEGNLLELGRKWAKTERARRVFDNPRLSKLCGNSLHACGYGDGGDSFESSSKALLSGGRSRVFSGG
jgi:hypothetical protein